MNMANQVHEAITKYLDSGANSKNIAEQNYLLLEALRALQKAECLYLPEEIDERKAQNGQYAVSRIHVGLKAGTSEWLLPVFTEEPLCEEYIKNEKGIHLVTVKTNTRLFLRMLTETPDCPEAVVDYGEAGNTVFAIKDSCLSILRVLLKNPDASDEECLSAVVEDRINKKHQAN
jgi:hypothetical protein